MTDPKEKEAVITTVFIVAALISGKYTLSKLDRKPLLEGARELAKEILESK